MLLRAVISRAGSPLVPYQDRQETKTRKGEEAEKQFFPKTHIQTNRPSKHTPVVFLDVS